MSVFSPDQYVASIYSIDLDELKRSGIDALLVDLDNTLLPRDSDIMPEELRDWAATLARRGFRVCLVSNNWHARVTGVAEELGFALVSKAVKPLPFAFLHALRKLGSTRKRAVVIGDQVFTDVLGGNLIGARTVLVTPVSASDLPHTLMLRRLERVVLAGRTPLP